MSQFSCPCWLIKVQCWHVQLAPLGDWDASIMSTSCKPWGSGEGAKKQTINKNDQGPGFMIIGALLGCNGGQCCFLASLDSNQDVYLGFIKQPVLKATEIFRVRNSLTMWVWIPFRLRVKHHDKRFQREMRRKFSSVCDQDDIWIGNEVCSRLIIC